jgi:hypothetical protein
MERENRRQSQKTGTIHPGQPCCARGRARSVSATDGLAVFPRGSDGEVRRLIFRFPDFPLSAFYFEVHW